MIRLAAPLVALVLAGCSPAQPGAARGGDISGIGRPRIVSLNPCSDAILAEVAAPGQLLAISHYSQDPASTSMDIARARSFRAVAGSTEEVLALGPDVVVAGSFLPPATAQALRDLGIRVVTLPMPASIAQSQAQVRELARLTGNIAAGERLVGDIDLSLAKAAPAPGTPALSALVWESGGIVAGDGTLIAELLRRTGFVNSAAARGLSQADFLPLERMVAEPPRVVFTTGSEASEEDRLLRHPALAALPGLKRAPFPGALLWCGGPTIPRAAARLAAVRRMVGS